MNFEEQLAADVREIEEILKRYLPKEEGYAKTVAEAVNYSVLAGGKMCIRDRFSSLNMTDTASIFWIRRDIRISPRIPTGR